MESQVQTAEIQLTEAIRLLETFDGLANEVIKQRINLELFAADPEVAKENNIDINVQKRHYREVQGRLNKFEAHVRRDWDSLDELRRKIARAQALSEMLSRLESRIIKENAYLDMYQRSGTTPVDLDSEEEFSIQEERLKLSTLLLQKETVQGEFLEAVKEIALGEPSEIILPNVSQIQRID